ncbi:class I SAM-dependent methyltransferase [Nitrospira moscoviensis]|uniref:Putative 3-demethylubiquinone-9 3-methyltransferase domain protein n=1 Tax=Nitrospira moscoviensis TaxID=42253 RepID=A0A0K2GB71_NITMO|nr:class I SAM-dependent methyltransferase [Nitrospira moscoviensis]ALA58216.1 putative 3-demethylubiquinone-9 3-methyltransferase domain protein [Nitrospira moscoviensis]
MRAQAYPNHIIGGNVFDKYHSSNPVAGLLVRNFLHTMLGMLAPLPIKHVLDIGCGEGYVLNLLCRQLKPEKAEGVDVVLDVVSRARHEHPHLAFSVASVYELPYATKCADLIVMSEVLEHLDDPAKALTEVRRVAARFCLFSVPHEPLWRILNVMRLTYLRDMGNTPGHVQHFSSRTFLAALREQFHVRQLAMPFPWLMALCERRDP